MNTLEKIDGCAPRIYAGQLPRHLASALRCYGGGSSTSEAPTTTTTTTTDKRIGASDQAIVSSVDNSGGGASNTGSILKDVGSVNVSNVTSDPGTIKNALDTLQNILSGANATVQTITGQSEANVGDSLNIVQGTLQNESDKLDQELKAIKDLASTTAAPDSKIVQYALLALAAVGVVIAWRSKKS